MIYNLLSTNTRFSHFRMSCHKSSVSSRSFLLKSEKYPQNTNKFSYAIAVVGELTTYAHYITIPMHRTKHFIFSSLLPRITRVGLFRYGRIQIGSYESSRTTRDTIVLTKTSHRNRAYFKCERAISEP